MKTLCFQAFKVRVTWGRVTYFTYHFISKGQNVSPYIVCDNHFGDLFEYEPF